MTVRPMAGVSAFRSDGRLAVLVTHRPSPICLKQSLWAPGMTVKAVTGVEPMVAPEPRTVKRPHGARAEVAFRLLLFSKPVPANRSVILFERVYS
ncbi:hypothetical protein D3C86_1230530 [compost metagenome]